MPFVIDQKIIEFEDYKSLTRYSESYPSVNDIVCFLIDWYDDGLDSISVLTSGSTGKPKEIRLRKLSMIESAKKTQAHFNYKSGDKSLLCLPAKYIAGKMMLVRSIISNLNLLLVEPSENPLANISAEIDFLPMTPYQFLRTAELNRYRLNLIDKILLGGGPISTKVIEIINKIETQVYHGFGMTETITHIAVKQLEPLRLNPYEALTGVSFSVDQNSCLIIDSDHLPTKIYTRDIVELINATSFNWRGRLDNVINSGGIKLHPEVIELKIKNLITCPYFLIGQKDEILGERLVLIIEAVSSFQLEQLKVELSKVLSKYELPKEILFVEYFILTETGKVKRSETFEWALKNN